MCAGEWYYWVPQMSLEYYSHIISLQRNSLILQECTPFYGRLVSQIRSQWTLYHRTNQMERSPTTTWIWQAAGYTTLKWNISLTSGIVITLNAQTTFRSYGDIVRNKPCTPPPWTRFSTYKPYTSVTTKTYPDMILSEGLPMGSPTARPNPHTSKNRPSFLHGCHEPT